VKRDTNGTEPDLNQQRDRMQMWRIVRPFERGRWKNDSTQLWSRIGDDGKDGEGRRDTRSASGGRCCDGRANAPPHALAAIVRSPQPGALLTRLRAARHRAQRELRRQDIADRRRQDHDEEDRAAAVRCQKRHWNRFYWITAVKTPAEVAAAA